MFVQCAKFVEEHRGSANRELSVYGQEQKEVTVPLARMNLALHGLSGDIRLGNSYYDDLHDSTGAFDFVMANPPFNVNGVDKDKLAGDPRFPFGLPRPDNGNYLWIQLFYSALAEHGRAGFVMANSAGDAALVRGRDPPPADRVEVGRRDGGHRHQLLLHGDVAGDALVPRPRQARHAARGHGAVHRRAPSLPPDRPRPSRLPARADRAPRQHRAALPRRGRGAGRRFASRC